MNQEPIVVGSWAQARFLAGRLAVAATNALLVAGGPGAAAVLLTTTALAQLRHARPG